MPAAADPSDLVVGVISDTHDHLYPEVAALLTGVDHIIHAGDVCSPGLLTQLRAIAPLTVARGNCDEGSWADDLPTRVELDLAGVRIVVGHIGGRVRQEAAARAAAAAGAEPIDVVIFGHSHQSLVEWKDGLLHLNPGSAGPRRYGRPRTMAFLRIAADDGTTAAPAARVSADIVMVEA